MEFSAQDGAELSFRAGAGMCFVTTPREGVTMVSGANSVP